MKQRKRPISKRAIGKAKEAIVEYLRAGLTVSTACQLAGINKRTFYNWLNNDESFALQVDEAEGAAIASAEMVIMEAMRRGDTKVAMWFLERRCSDYAASKSREIDGYSIEILAPPDDGSVPYTVHLRNGSSHDD